MLKGGDGKILLDNWQEEVRKKYYMIFFTFTTILPNPTLKFSLVKKSTTVNTFVLNTLRRNITLLAVTTRNTNIKFGSLKGGKLEKSQNF